jgi:hypothetical protein
VTTVPHLASALDNPDRHSNSSRQGRGLENIPLGRAIGAERFWRRYSCLMHIPKGIVRTVLAAPATVIFLAAGAPQTAPPRTPADCSLGKAVHELAQNMHIRVGFESLPGCLPGPRQAARTDAMPPLAASARASLDRLLATAPEFSWKSVGDVFVIRPTAAWTDADDPLNFSTMPFSLNEVDVDSALQAIIQHVEPTIYLPNVVTRRRAGSLTLAFSGGTFVEALSALVASGGLDRWEVTWRSVGMVTVQSRDMGGLWASAPL